MAANDGIDLPGEMQTLFEDGKLVDASARAEAERNAMVTIAGAAAAQTSETDPLTTIGMVGEDPGADLVAARAALEAGDLDATLAAADDAYRGWTGAWQEGRRRTLLLIAVLATIVVLTSAVIGRVRGARATAGAAASAGRSTARDDAGRRRSRSSPSTTTRPPRSCSPPPRPRSRTPARRPPPDRPATPPDAPLVTHRACPCT